MAGICDRAAGVFFLDIAVQIGGVADLGLHFFFAVAVIVVGDERDDDAGIRPAGELKCDAVVVFFRLAFPAHAVAFLAIGGFVDVWKADLFLREIRKMRRKDDAAGVAGPMLDVEPGIVLGQERIGGVAEDGFDEIVRLLTRVPGAKKRSSMVFSAVNPGTAGQTMGRR